MNEKVFTLAAWGSFGIGGGLWATAFLVIRDALEFPDSEIAQSRFDQISHYDGEPGTNWAGFFELDSPFGLGTYFIIISLLLGLPQAVKTVKTARG